MCSVSHTHRLAEAQRGGGATQTCRTGGESGFSQRSSLEPTAEGGGKGMTCWGWQGQSSLKEGCEGGAGSEAKGMGADKGREANSGWYPSSESRMWGLPRADGPRPVDLRARLEDFSAVPLRATHPALPENGGGQETLELGAGWLGAGPHWLPLR